MAAAKRLFHDRQRMRFVAVTIPTLMAVAETERLVTSLTKEGIPVGALVINQARDALQRYVFQVQHDRWCRIVVCIVSGCSLFPSTPQPLSSSASAR